MLIFIVSGCESLKSEWVKSDRALFDALSPQIPIWVESDTTLTDLQKEDYFQLLRSWEECLIKAEELIND